MINCIFENGNKASLRHAVVDVIVLKDDKILLGKRADHLLEGGKWGLIGGFVDRDETLKEAAQREIKEETGWQVENLTLFRIIDSPNRPKEDRQNISFVFFCEAIKKDGESDEEVKELEWFDLSALPPRQEIAFDHFESIEVYKKYLNNKVSLPVLGGVA